MIDKLIEIPGPLFLLIFSVYSIIIISLSKIYSGRDYSYGYQIPEPTSLSPLDIAILRDGVKGAIALSIFNLWQKKAVDINTSEHALYIKQMPVSTDGMNKLEKTIYNFSSQTRTYRQFFIKKSVQTTDKILLPNKIKLQQLNLVADSRVINHRWKAIKFGAFFILLLGGSKMYFGFMRNKPVAFLILLMIISLIALFLIIRPQKIKTSTLGEKFLKLVKIRFEYLKSSSEKSVVSDSNLLYGVAAFGITAFLGSQIGSLLDNPYIFEQMGRTASDGTGCGGGCSGGCGGGGCGGGCGGCGGD